MRKIIAMIVFYASSWCATAQDGSTFGQVFTPQDVLPASRVVAMVGKDSVSVQTEATVKEVCQAKGCWMKVDAGDGREMLVRFKNYGFFVPKDAAGKKVVLKGKAFLYETSVAELRHYAEDAGKSKREIAAIRKPERSVRFVADGLVLK